MSQSSTAPNAATSPTTVSNAPPQWTTFALFPVIGLLLAAVFARLAVWLQTSRFNGPIGILPILIGVAIGLSYSLLATYLDSRNRLSIIAFAAISAFATAAAEHAYFYMEYRNAFAASQSSGTNSPLDPQAQYFVAISPVAPTPATFSEFISAAAPAKWPLWTANALTMITISALVAWLLSSTTTAKPLRPANRTSTPASCP